MPQRWELAVGGLYCQLYGISPNILGSGDWHWETRAREFLRSDWRISTKQDLLVEIDTLKTFNRYRAYDLTEGRQVAALPAFSQGLVHFLQPKGTARLEAMRDNYLRWKDRSGLAGDLCRASMLVNLGYAAGLIDEREAWAQLNPIARAAQQNFTSWNEMCDNFLDTLDMWTGEDNPRFDACADLLCNRKDPNSPWTQIPWQTKLSGP
jgi:hypothetical protein